MEQEPDKPRLALNTYCRPFFVPPSHLGIWCPEGRSIRIVCFDPDQLKAFDFAEIAGWFKQSSERIYSATEPIADFEVALGLAAGMHKIEVPAELQTVDELIIPDQLSGERPGRSGFRALRRLSSRRDWSRSCRRNGSPPASTRWESNGSRGRRAIRSRIGFLASVLEPAAFCWRKMDAAWNDGWRRDLRLKIACLVDDLAMSLNAADLVLLKSEIAESSNLKRIHQTRSRTVQLLTRLTFAPCCSAVIP